MRPLTPDPWGAVKKLDPRASRQKQQAFYGAYKSSDPEMRKSRTAIQRFSGEYMLEHGWTFADTSSSYNRRRMVKAVVKRMRSAGIPFMPVKATRKGPYFDAVADKPNDWVNYLIEVAQPDQKWSSNDGGGVLRPRAKPMGITHVPLWQAPLMPLLGAWRWWSHFPPKAQMKYIGIALGVTWIYLILFVGDYGL